MGIVETIIRKPVTIIVSFSLVLIVGIFVSGKIPVDLLPSISQPVITVSTVLSGASSQEIEENITKILEESFFTINGVKHMESISSTGISNIIITFEYNTNLDIAKSDIRDRLEIVRNVLPSDSVTQILQLDNTENIPTLIIQLTGNRNLEDIYDIAKEKVQPLLERINGVAQAPIIGGEEKIVGIDVPLDRLIAHRITLSQIAGALRQNNTTASGGVLSVGNIDYQVETKGTFSTLDDIRETVIIRKITSEGKPYFLRVKDVGDVHYDTQSNSSKAYVNGNPAIYFAIMKRSNSNTVKVSDNVQAEFLKIKNFLPTDMEINTLFDVADIVRQSLSNVTSSAIGGVLLAMGVLLIFLRSIRATLVIALAIPISIMVTLLAMQLFDLTINIMSLAGLALGIGLLVDNSVVVLENIYRYRSRGTQLISAATFGTKEMIVPLFASTLTSVIVFAPMFLFKKDLGDINALFGPLIFTVIISLLVSLLVAIFLVPVLISKYFRIGSAQETSKKFWTPIILVLENSYKWFEKNYQKVLRVLLNRKGLTIIGMMVVGVLIIFLIPTPKFALYPNFSEGQIIAFVTLPAGTQKEHTLSILQELEKYIKRQVPEIKKTVTFVGEAVGRRGSGDKVLKGNVGHLTIMMPPYKEQTMHTDKVANLLRSQFSKYPSAAFTLDKQGSLQEDDPVKILIKGQNSKAIKMFAKKVLALMQEQYVTDRQGNKHFLYEGVHIDEEEPAPQVSIILDRSRAYALGLDVQNIGREISVMLSGISSGVFKTKARDYDIIVQVPNKDKRALEKLGMLSFFTPDGKRVSLNNIARFSHGQTEEQIKRDNQSRYISILSRLSPLASISIEVPKLRMLIQRKIPPSPGIQVEFSGEFEDLNKQKRIFLLIILLSVLLVFGVMASLFESFLDPFIIFFTIPLTFIGVYFIYGITGDVINAFSAGGLVMLIGIVVNNAIVLVDYTNILRKRGMPLVTACVEAGGRRLRPILITSFTTIIGMAPLAFSVGEGSSLIQPIAKTVIGGLFASTFLTLLFIPVLYAIFNKRSERKKIKIAQEINMLRKAGEKANG